MSAIKACWKWYPKKKGTAAGVIFFGSGLSSAIFNPIATFIINPEGVKPITHPSGNKYYEPDIAVRIYDYITISSTIFLCLTFLATLLCFDPKPEEEQEM